MFSFIIGLVVAGCAMLFGQSDHMTAVDLGLWTMFVTAVVTSVIVFLLGAFVFITGLIAPDADAAGVGLVSSLIYTPMNAIFCLGCYMMAHGFQPEGVNDGLVVLGAIIALITYILYKGVVTGVNEASAKAKVNKSCCKK